MNRPEKNLSKRIAYEDISKKELIRYGISLEKYCDVLEIEIGRLIASRNELERALDKTCEAIVWFSKVHRNCEVTACENCKYTNSKYCVANDKNDWKEWSLKDD